MIYIYVHSAIKFILAQICQLGIHMSYYYNSTLVQICHDSQVHCNYAGAGATTSHNIFRC